MPFRYCRSTSNPTLLLSPGFPFAPWKSAHAVAGGKEIYEYVRDTAKQFNIWENIRFNTRLMSANWDSKTARWTSEVDVNGERTQITSQFLYCCTGYYDYHNPHKADIPGIDSFEGKQIHPQFWDTKYDVTGKEIVVIGSGATAVTLLPALAPKSKHITMLQRSPSYFVAMPRADPIASLVKLIFPTAIGHTLNRLIWACKYFFFFKICRAFPRFMRRVLMGLVSWQLPKSTPLKPHFDPSYKPWDERICFVGSRLQIGWNMCSLTCLFFSCRSRMATCSLRSGAERPASRLATSRLSPRTASSSRAASSCLPT